MTEQRHIFFFYEMFLFTLFHFYLQDSIKWSQNKNLLLVWYEDILKDFEDKVNEIAQFTGFSVSENQMKVLNT